MILTQKEYRLAILSSLSIAFLICSVLVILVFVGLRNNHWQGSPALLGYISIVPVYFYLMRKYRRRKRILNEAFPDKWRQILLKEVAYYHGLNQEEKQLFEKMAQLFLGEIAITGIETDVDDVCRVLVAASAVIPVFRFPHWTYNKLSEVLVYPGSFDENFDFSGKKKNILGMVGIGKVMILAKNALYHGFRNASDKEHVGIHEFIHKIDEADGLIDGIPALLLNSQLQLQWQKLVDQEIDNINRGDSEINPYGATNAAEFFAVVSEYFFENPAALEKNHPEVYDFLTKIYQQDTKELLRSVSQNLFNRSTRIGRNSPCPCGSGKKFKHCCLV